MGYLTALDVLCDASYQLFEPLVNTLITAIFVPGSGGFGDGGFGEGGFGDDNSANSSITVASLDSIYVGSIVVIGYGLSTAEAVEVLAIGPVPLTFSCNLLNPHFIGEKVFGPTFPVQQPLDPLWTQGEMLAYLSTAANDFLDEVPLAYAINGNVSVPPTQQNALLPDDCMVPERVAFKMVAGPYPMRETSQSNLDAYDYRWQIAAQSQPRAYFRDKMPLQNFGIWPRVGNTAVFEVVYSQRQLAQMQLLDGFLFPDIFVPIVKYRLFSFAYSKDGEARNPGLAKYFSARYDFGVKVASLWLSALNDPNLEVAQ